MTVKTRGGKRAQKAGSSEAETELLAAEDFTPEESVRSVLAGLPSDGYLEIYRMTEEGEPAFCRRVRDLSSFSMADVAKHGAGQFKLVVRGGANGRPGAAPIRRQRMVWVDESAVPSTPEVAAPAAGQPAAPDMMMGLVAQMMQMMQQANSMFIQQSQASAQMHTAMMQSLIESKKPDGGMLQILTAMIARDKGDPMEMGLKLAEFMRGGAVPAVTLAEQVKSLRDLRGLFSDGGAEEPDWLKGLMAVVESPVIAKALDSVTAPRPMLPNPAERSKGAGANLQLIKAEADRPTLPANDPPGEDMPSGALGSLLRHLEPYVPMLVRAVAQNADPQTYAFLLLDQVPEALHTRLAELMTAPTFAADTGKMYPGLAAPAAAAWLQAVASEVRQVVEGGDDPPGATLEEDGADSALEDDPAGGNG